LPNVTYVHPDGSRDVLEVPVGTSVMEAAIDAGLDGIVAECGGNQMCATCHVYVEPAFADRLAAMEDGENEMLEATASERLPTSRLSCQLVADEGFEGLVVGLPESQL
jgi:ferredoxin, 2Fe-2S